MKPLDEDRGIEAEVYAETIYRIFSKLLEDLIEAYHRTPMTVSSRPYIERSLRLAEAGLTIARMLLDKLQSG